MFNKIRTKKGNITIILIGVISVMVLMTAALSKRMSGHTQLLMLSDYTQISRYFLESYISDVMQQMRAKANDPRENLYKELRKDFEKETIDLTSALKYTPSPKLKELAEKYNPKILYDYNGARPAISLVELSDGNKYIPLNYPEGITVGPDLKGKEKKGFIKIVCKCKFEKREFDKREYSLEVEYPYSVVFQMSPVVKDFMLFVDNMYYDQRAYQGDDWVKKDRINILGIENGEVNETEKAVTMDNYWLPARFHTYRIRPMVLLAALSRSTLDDQRDSGMVYFGPTTDSNGDHDDSCDKSIFLNLSGITPDSTVEQKKMDLNDMYLIPGSAFMPEGAVVSGGLMSGEPVNFPIGYNGSSVQAYGVNVELEEGHQAGQVKVGVFGFCKELSKFLGKASQHWTLKHFLGEKESGSENILADTFWEKICDEPNYDKYLEYSSGIKPYGLRFSFITDESMATRRMIFGNVFERFIVLTFWYSEYGQALQYHPNLGIDKINEKLKGIAPSFLKNRDLKFWPKGYYEGMNEGEQIGMYRKYMSKIMSGLKPKDNYNANGDGTYQKLFIPLNTDYELNQHQVFYEDKFTPNDGFRVEQGMFDSLNKKWFEASANEVDRKRSLESRIGRAYGAPEKFLAAVGYNPDKKKFKVNGVVYVKGDLDIHEGMDIAPEDCTGGIVIVDGNLTIGNVTRGVTFEASKFNYTSDSSPATTIFEEWNDPAKTDKYIGPDKILTFVCIGENRKITITGNVLLGVQLINLSSNNPTSSSFEDQISWELSDNSDEIIYYGSIVCNRLNLVNRLLEFGKIKKNSDNVLKAPFFMYPPVMATATPPLAVQVMENMRGYKLTSEVVN